MTDRINAFVVVLARDIRDDDVEATQNAIMQIKGVISVENNISDVSDIVAASREKQKVTEKLYALIDEFNKL